VADCLHSLWCRAVIRPRTLTLLAAATAALALAACGGGTKTASIPSGAPGEETAAKSAPITTPKPSPPPPAVKALAAKVGTDTKKKPAIPKPSGQPPIKLIADDIVTGKGAAVRSGDSVTVDYVGVHWTNGKEFDSSWKRKQTFPFTVGQGVIEGWSDGVVGMKVGGRRMLVIPPDLAYGASGSPPSIGPNETLVFVIDLRKIG
jgi:FKBP-type peptidyl-prolyl cis-trans isomerase